MRLLKSGHIHHITGELGQPSGQLSWGGVNDKGEVLCLWSISTK